MLGFSPLAAAPLGDDQAPVAGGSPATLTCEAQSYSLSGTDVTLRVSRRLTAESQSYSLTGAAADLSKQSGIILTCEAGSFGVAGTSVSFTVARRLTAEAATYTLTGPDVAIAAGAILTAQSQSYVLSGAAVTLRVSRRLTCEAGSFSLSGSDTTITSPSGSVTLTCEAGSYVLTGASVTLLTKCSLLDDVGNPLLDSNDGYLLDGACGSDIPIGSHSRFAKISANHPTILSLQGAVSVIGEQNHKC